MPQEIRYMQNPVTPYAEVDGVGIAPAVRKRRADTAQRPWNALYLSTDQGQVCIGHIVAGSFVPDGDVVGMGWLKLKDCEPVNASAVTFRKAAIKAAIEQERKAKPSKALRFVWVTRQRKIVALLQELGFAPRRSDTDVEANLDSRTPTEFWKEYPAYGSGVVQEQNDAPTLQ